MSSKNFMSYEDAEEVLGEYADAINSLKSGLTNLTDAVGWDNHKNLLPMTVDGIKAANTTGTWNNNVYTIDTVTFTVQTDDLNAVTDIVVNGTNNGNAIYFIAGKFGFKANTSYVVNGVQENSGINFMAVQGGITLTEVRDYTQTFNADTNANIYIILNSNATASNVLFKPMIRKASDTDPTFQPFHPVIGPAVEELQSELTNLSDKIKHIFVGGCVAGLALNDGDISFSVPMVGLYTTIASASATCTGTIYGSIGAIGGVTFTMSTNSLNNGVLRFRLTPSVTLSTYTDPAKVVMCELDKIEFTVS